jgi:uncharacterized protein
VAIATASFCLDDATLPQLQADAVMVRLGREFLKAAERGDALAVGAFLEEGFPANWQDSRTKETALHVAAASRARDVLRILLNADQSDYLLRDKGGRLASDLAFLNGRDSAAARLLGVKERKQAEAQGIQIKRRSHTSLRTRLGAGCPYRNARPVALSSGRTRPR